MQAVEFTFEIYFHLYKRQEQLYSVPDKIKQKENLNKHYGN